MSVTVTSPTRLADEIPAAAASTTLPTASGRSAAARSATRPPSECPTHGAGTASSASATASTASAKGSSDDAPPSGSDPPCPGSSGTSTRWRAASVGATSRQLAAAPPSPWTSTMRRPRAADEVPDPRSRMVERALLESLDLRFCVRPHEGIFFAQWMPCWDGPSDARHLDKKGSRLTRLSARRRRVFSCPGKEQAGWRITSRPKSCRKS